MALKLPPRGLQCSQALYTSTLLPGHVATQAATRSPRGVSLPLRSGFLGATSPGLRFSSSSAQALVQEGETEEVQEKRRIGAPVASTLNSHAASVEAPPISIPTSAPFQTHVPASARATPASAPLAYELVQGPLVRWSATSRNSAYSAPPTAVFLHGILGSRKNWSSFARRLAREFPSWQMLLVDLRCHGESSSAGGSATSERHSVEAAARDVLKLVHHLKLVPQILVGHSFGGKVALSMVDQAPKPLAKPVQVWVLDATPGDVHAGGDGEDHPKELIHALAAMNGPITDRKQVITKLKTQGFSDQISQWMTTNLKPANVDGLLEWRFDLRGISQMYDSYEGTNMWPIVESVPEGVRIEFLRAERSLHRWAHGDVQRISAAELRASREGAGVRMHVLEDAGHWVHADNPDGLFRILGPAFGGGKF